MRGMFPGDAWARVTCPRPRDASRDLANSVGEGGVGVGVELSKVRDCAAGVKGGSWNLNYQGVVAVSKWPTGLRNIQGSTNEDQTPN